MQPVSSVTISILLHKQGFPYAPTHNNPMVPYLVTLVGRIAALPGQSSDLQTPGSNTVVHMLQSALVHYHAETTYPVWAQVAHLPVVLAGGIQGH
jgi:hypothetical protein